MKRFHVVPIYGGQSYTLQIRQLKHSPQVIVGTPGRVMDHMRRGTLSLDGSESLGARRGRRDAAHGLCRGHRLDLRAHSRDLPDGAVLGHHAAGHRARSPATPEEPGGGPHRGRRTRTSTPSTRAIAWSRAHHKLDALTRILEMEHFDGMLIFVRTKTATTELADKLKAHGFAAEPLNGDMNQQMRERTVERLRRGKLDILVATDVAARGLDVERISHVVNYDIPTDPQTYVHRIGRTGRAGRDRPGHPAGGAPRARAAARHRAHLPLPGAADGAAERRAAHQLAHRPLHRRAAQDPDGSGSGLLLPAGARTSPATRSWSRWISPRRWPFSCSANGRWRSRNCRGRPSAATVQTSAGASEGTTVVGRKATGATAASVRTAGLPRRRSTRTTPRATARPRRFRPGGLSHRGRP